MKIFIICTVRLATEEYKTKLENYVWELEKQGNIVHLPHRDTDQTANGFDICTQNMLAIKSADEVHIFYSSTSLGTHFDMGVAFALNKPIVVVENEPITQAKGFQRVLAKWTNMR